MERITGVALPDVVKVTCYRHRFFGTPFNDLVQAAMRGPSFWSVAERELFAARTSKLNTCPFCVSGHQPMAASYGGSEVAAAVEAPKDASIRAAAKAVLVFLDKLAGDPDSVGAPDAAAVSDAGVPAGALEEAVRIAVLFHVINRLMNGLGSTAMPDRQQRMGVRLIRLLGYRTPLVVRIMSRAR
ncbi:MAG: hypothetical protein WCG47_24810 [Dermatophilaceae bacterium]